VKHRLPVLAVFCLAAGPAFSADVRGPVSGYVFDPGAGAVRPINGMPGAAVMGDALPLPGPLAAAAIDSRRQVMVGILREGGAAVLVRDFASPNVETLALDGAIRPADDVVLNAAGTQALVYSKVLGQVQLITGLADNPSAGVPASIGHLGEVAAMAASPAGPEAVLSTQGSAGGGVYTISFQPDALPVVSPVRKAESAAAVAFDSDGARLLIADPARGVSVVSAADPSGTSAEGEGPAGPVCVWRHSGRLAVADRASSSVALFDLATLHKVQEIALPSLPTRCSPLDGGLMLLNQPGRAPLSLIDFGSEPFVFFVPARSND
jgi:hypothetical protein